jgi:hypothetical protein
LAYPGSDPRTLRSPPPLNRFQEIFHAIKTNRYPNRTQLARSIEVTTKTIQRDLDYMRYQLGLPIEFDYARGGYYFTDYRPALVSVDRSRAGVRLRGAESVGSLQGNAV